MSGTAALLNCFLELIYNSGFSLIFGDDL